MKRSINLGSYGWRHAHWATTFYPEDLPAETGEDWRLAYYSNEFSTALVPCTYWQSARAADCASWLDDVHDDFRFIIECQTSMFAYISPSELIDCLSQLRPQLSALIFPDSEPFESELLEPFFPLINSLALDVFSAADIFDLPLQRPTQKIWRPDNPQISKLALIEKDLPNLRAARKLVEDFVASSVDSEKKSERQNDKGNKDEDNSELSIIVSHPQLQAGDLSKFRSVLEIMGY